MLFYNILSGVLIYYDRRTKYLQSDLSGKPPYCTLGLNIALFDIKK